MASGLMPSLVSIAAFDSLLILSNFSSSCGTACMLSCRSTMSFFHFSICFFLLSNSQFLSPIHLPYRQKHAREFPCAFSKFFFLAGGVNFWSNFLNISLNFEKHIFLQSNGRFEILD